MSQFLTYISACFHALFEAILPFIEFVRADSVSRFSLAVIIVLGFGFVFLPAKPKKSPTDFTSKDLGLIAGEDIVATQLDLAKAYIEMDKKLLARKMLKDIAKEGNQVQQKQARQLMKAL